MASSKKTGPSKSKSSKANTDDPKFEDAVIVEEEKTPQADAAAPEDSGSTDDKASSAEDQTAERVEADATVAEQTAAEEAPAPEQAPETVAEEPAAQETTTTAEIVHPVPAMAPEPEKKGSGFLPLVLGGIIAGGIGFFAAQSDLFQKPDDGVTNALRSDLTAQQERISALEAAEPVAVELPEVDFSPIQGQLAELEARIAALEERPATAPSEGGNAEAAQAYAAELEALRTSMAAQRSEIEALINNAKTVEQATAEAAMTASAQAAIARIVSAIDAGRPFADEVAELQTLDLGEIDPALVSAAGDGVPTLSALQTEFPEQARTALSVARANDAGEGQQGFGDFLKRSLGARSVAPREGDDPDAVLSRAEAAINSGDLSATLAELDTLPEEAQSAIADWRAAADARVAAQMAADALSQRLTAD